MSGTLSPEYSIQEEIWRVHEIHLCYERTGEVYVKQMGNSAFTNEVQQLLEF
jgi:hypothetical protein